MLSKIKTIFISNIEDSVIEVQNVGFLTFWTSNPIVFLNNNLHNIYYSILVNNKWSEAKTISTIFWKKHIIRLPFKSQKIKFFSDSKRAFSFCTFNEIKENKSNISNTLITREVDLHGSSQEINVICDTQLTIQSKNDCVIFVSEFDGINWSLPFCTKIEKDVIYHYCNQYKDLCISSFEPIELTVNGSCFESQLNLNKNLETNQIRESFVQSIIGRHLIGNNEEIDIQDGEQNGQSCIENISLTKDKYFSKSKIIFNNCKITSQLKFKNCNIYFKNCYIEGNVINQQSNIIFNKCNIRKLSGSNFKIFNSNINILNSDNSFIHSSSIQKYEGIGSTFFNSYPKIAKNIQIFNTKINDIEIKGDFVEFYGCKFYNTISNNSDSVSFSGCVFDHSDNIIKNEKESNIRFENNDIVGNFINGKRCNLHYTNNAACFGDLELKYNGLGSNNIQDFGKFTDNTQNQMPNKVNLENAGKYLNCLGKISNSNTELYTDDKQIDIGSTYFPKPGCLVPTLKHNKTVWNDHLDTKQSLFCQDTNIETCDLVNGFCGSELNTINLKNFKTLSLVFCPNDFNLKKLASTPEIDIYFGEIIPEISLAIKYLDKVYFYNNFIVDPYRPIHWMIYKLNRTFKFFINGVEAKVDHIIHKDPIKSNNKFIFHEIHIWNRHLTNQESIAWNYQINDKYKINVKI